MSNLFIINSNINFFIRYYFKDKIYLYLHLLLNSKFHYFIKVQGFINSKNF